MKREFLGDSYDMVKRLWADLLRKAAPLCADPVFFKDDDKDKEGALQREFTRLTGIPMEAGRPSGVFSILLDPNTGISLKDKRPRYVTTAYIAKRLGESGVRYVVTYDQSFGHGGPKALEAARQEKMARMKEHGYPSFYYVSHASFLFAAGSQQDLRELRTIIEKAGVPSERIHEELSTAGRASDVSK